MNRCPNCHKANLNLQKNGNYRCPSCRKVFVRKSEEDNVWKSLPLPLQIFFGARGVVVVAVLTLFILGEFLLPSREKKINSDFVFHIGGIVVGGFFVAQSMFITFAGFIKPISVKLLMIGIPTFPVFAWILLKNIKDFQHTSYTFAATLSLIFIVGTLLLGILVHNIQNLFDDAVKYVIIHFLGEKALNWYQAKKDQQFKEVIQVVDKAPKKSTNKPRSQKSEKPSQLRKK